MAAIVDPPLASKLRTLGTVASLEEFEARFGDDRVEVIDGVVVELPMPHWNHGRVCFKVASRIGGWIDDRDLGFVATNDTFVRLRSDPLLVRGPDLLFISYARLPRGSEPRGVLCAPPELAVEVRSPSDTWIELRLKASQYLEAGVDVVLVLDPDSRSIEAFRKGIDPVRFDAEGILEIPDVLPGFTVSVAKLFE